MNDTVLKKEYSSDLIQLIAYIVQCDKVVSKEEIDYVYKYIKSSYSPEISDQVYHEFLVSLDKRNPLETICSNISVGIGSDRDRIVSFAMQIYELIAADQIDPEELLMFENICELLRIDDRDIDLIKSLMIDSYHYKFSSNIDRKLEIGDDPVSSDIVFESVRLTIFTMGGPRFLLNFDSEVNVYVDDQLVPNRKIIPLTNRELITFENRSIAVADIDLYYDLRNKGYHKEVLLAFATTSINTVLNEEEAHLKVVIDRNIIRMYKLKDISIKQNKIETEDFEFITLTDQLVIDNEFALPLREILLGADRTHYSLEQRTGEKDQLVISNKARSADIFIEDNYEEELLIEVEIKRQRGGACFTLVPRKVPYPVFIRETALSEGRSMDVPHNGKLRIGTTQLLFDCKACNIIRSHIKIDSLKVQNLTYYFKNDIGIDGLSFEAKSGELNCIMGVSGAGKTTLLKLLLGYLKPHGGAVMVNGMNFYNNFDSIKHHIGYVPQDDLLLENLTVYENMYYAAKVRMPELKQREVGHLVNRVLKDIGLFDKKDLKVGNVVDKVLSGGQRKRLNIGLELLSDPDLFFLDEPTSGLSSIDSENVIHLLSNLAKRGKIIFVVIHQPSSTIYKKFNNLLLLDIGGRLAYYGDTLEAVRYFKDFLPIKDEFVECPSCGSIDHEIIFNIVEQKEIGRDGLPVYETSVKSSSGLKRLWKKTETVSKPKRRYDPEFWKQLFITRNKECSCGENGESGGAALPLKTAQQGAVQRFFRDLLVLKSLYLRAFMEKYRDRSNLIMTFVLPLALGLGLGFILKGGPDPYMFNSNTEYPKFLFISVIVFIFMGLLSGVNLVIKDRPIIIREKLVDIKPWQYLLSKSAVFLTFATLQVLIYSAITLAVLQVPVLPPWGFNVLHGPLSNLMLHFFLTGLITAYVSFALGALVSSYFKSEYTALQVSIVIMIPQIVFGGLFLEYHSISRLLPLILPQSAMQYYKQSPVPSYCNLVFSRWSYEALLSGSLYYNPIEKIIEFPDVNDHELTSSLVNNLKGKAMLFLPLAIDQELFDDRIVKNFTLTAAQDLAPGNKKILMALTDPLTVAELEDKQNNDKETLTTDEQDALAAARKRIGAGGAYDIEGNELEEAVKRRKEVLGQLYGTKANDELRYHRKLLLPPETAAFIRDVFRVTGYRTLYDYYSWNSTVSGMMTDAKGNTRFCELIRMAKNGTLSVRWHEWFQSDNIFPSHYKLFGPYLFRTVWYNLVMLLMIAAVVNGVTLLRLRKESA